MLRKAARRTVHADSVVQGVAPLWYAYVVATDPDHQGKGYGSLLVREGLKLVHFLSAPEAISQC